MLQTVLNVTAAFQFICIPNAHWHYFYVNFVIGSSCHAKKVPCKKPQVEVQLPWDTEPISQVGQSPPPQHTITDDAATFTEDFIRAEHKEVIDGITKIYQTLKLIDYIDDAELIYPPHQHLPAQELASLGLEPEAIALLRYLPYLDIKDVEISPCTSSYNYLYNIQEARDVLWERKNDLAPWVIRLSYVSHLPSDWGRTIIYDIRTKKIIQWPNNTPSYANTYLDFPWLSPTEMFDEWLNFLRELKEMPWRTRSWRMVESEYPAAPFNWIDLIANGMVAEPPKEPPKELLTQYSRDCYNFDQARKYLFITHGWPDDFNASEFKAAKRVWQEEQRRLENSKKQATQADAKERASEEYSKFLEDTAGPGAFKKP